MEIDIIIEELEFLNSIISQDGKWLNIHHMQEFAKCVPNLIEQAVSLKEYIHEMQQVECRCEVDQMREIGVRQSDFI